MTEKILKLLQSNVFEDNYIGLKLLDNLPKKEIKAFLDKNLDKGEKEDMFTWIYRKEIRNRTPELYDSGYIKGNYYYVIGEADIIVDNSSMYRKTRSVFKDDEAYKIVEVWK